MNRKRKIVLGTGVVAVAFAFAAGIALRDATDDDGGEQDRGADAMDGMPGMDAGSAMDMGGANAMGGMDMDGSVRLTADEVATFGITFGLAEVRPLSRTIRTVGLVEFDETRMTYVAPKFGGWVERLHADFTGQPIRRGEPLLEVYSPELVTAQEELLMAARMAESVGESGVEGVADGARDLYTSARRRLAYWDISDEQIDRLVETGEVRKTLTLYAPVSGIVMEKDVFSGQAFQPGKNLYMIADLSQIWLSAEVFEADAGMIREGMPADITIAAIPGRSFSGRVEYVYPTLEDRTRSMRARISLDNPGGQLKPGMYATVRFTADLGETLTLPSSAVLQSGERAIAFVDMGGGELMPHELTLGVRGQGHVQVIAGVEPGQRVVTSAQFLLDSESNLAEVMKAMMAQMNMSDMEGMDMEGMDMQGGSMEGMDMDGSSMDGMDMSRPDSTGGR
ncbi:MAG: efflux RND transporter periplasmic adaptor subunit [Longimicrobiales bacterium]